MRHFYPKIQIFSRKPDFFQTNSITFILIIPIAVTFKCSNQKSKKNEKKNDLKI